MSSIANTASSLEELEEKLNTKLRLMTACGNLRGGWGSDTIVFLSACSEELKVIRNEINGYKKSLCLAKEQIQTVKELSSPLALLTDRLRYMKSNLPQHVPCNDQSERSQDAIAQMKDVQNKPSFDKMKEAYFAPTVRAAAKPVLKVKYITVDEFATLPKYRKGRLQYEKVNKVIEQINVAVESKYALLRKPRCKLSPLEMSYVQDFKRQINKESRGLFFVVEEDIKRFSSMRLDSAGRNILMILRTLKRLKEVRGPANIVRYCVMN